MIQVAQTTDTPMRVHHGKTINCFMGVKVNCFMSFIKLLLICPLAWLTFIYRLLVARKSTECYFFFFFFFFFSVLSLIPSYFGPETGRFIYFELLLFLIRSRLEAWLFGPRNILSLPSWKHRNKIFRCSPSCWWRGISINTCFTKIWGNYRWKHCPKVYRRWAFPDYQHGLAITWRSWILQWITVSGKQTDYWMV